MIPEDKLQELNTWLLNSQSVEELIGAFSKDEPVIYSWMMRHAKDAIKDLVDIKLKLTPDASMCIYNHICMSYLMMYGLIRKDLDSKFKEIMKGDHFQAFIDGRADEKFYNYSIEGLASDSTLFQAKTAKMKRTIEDLRKVLLPILCEDAGRGKASREALDRVDKIAYGK